MAHVGKLELAVSVPERQAPPGIKKHSSKLMTFFPGTGGYMVGQLKLLGTQVGRVEFAVSAPGEQNTSTT